MRVSQLLLYPFTVVYDGVTRFRNHLYDIAYKPAFHFETVTISVGNLAVGGTGKTPMIEYLIRLLDSKYTLATLSRGYGRKTKGFKIISSEDNASTAGDEPFQFFLKFGSTVTVTVGEERAVAIPEILYSKEDTDVILLDDAFQHRKVARDLNILLTTFEAPFFDDYLLPAGRLREARSGAKRADVVVVTKCPKEVSEETRKAYIQSIKKLTLTDVPVFFTTIRYGTPFPVYAGDNQAQGTVILVSGLANATYFEESVKTSYKVGHHFQYGDHHDYSLEDVRQIKERYDAVAAPDKFILTTEKDMVKFLNPELQSALRDIPFFYLPIEVGFLSDGDEFDQLVLETIQNRKEELAQ